MTLTTEKTPETTLTLPQMVAMGLIHHQSGRIAEAKELYMQVLSAEPENFDALHLLGVLAHQVGNHDLAVSLMEKAVQQNAGNAVVFNNLGEAYKGTKRLDEAERCYRKALELNPDFTEVFSNLGNALKDLGRLEDAVQVYLQALAIKPDFVLVHYNLGNVLKDLGELDDAEASFAEAVALNPDYADASQSISVLHLMRGDYRQGLSYFQQRFVPGGDSAVGRGKKYLGQLQGQQRWQGESLAGRRLLLVTEHGAGDNLMMMRYLPLVKKRKPERLLVYATPHLARVLQSLGCLDEVIPMTSPLPLGAFDLYCPMMSLPYLFETSLDSIPAKVPYLSLPKEMKKQWRSKLKKEPGVKVGLAWGAGKLSGTNARRSIALERLAPLAEVPGVRLVTLQKGTAAGQLQGLDCPVIDCMTECKDFLDTAGLVEQLDLVISVDTSVAHLAGALGKPVWLLNCFESEWRWMLDREDSPWYPSMRIFRQKQRGDWDGVISEASEQLENFVKNR
jgi:tetratricopeptide (TPR) repeat protein